MNKKIIVSTRKRDDTKAYGKNCLWRCFVVPFVEIDESGNRLEQWILRYGKNRESALPTTAHSHEPQVSKIIVCPACFGEDAKKQLYSVGS
jgi:hypothetical protein